MTYGTVFSIKHFAVHDGDGIRTTVFLKGCPLRCIWCHNPEGLSPKPELSFYTNKCVNCGLCTTVCKCHQIIGGTHVFDRTACVSCGKCESICPKDALFLQGKQMSVEEVLQDVLQDRDFYENSNGGVTLSGGECLMQPDFCEELLKALKREGIHTAVDTCGYVKREILNRIMPYADIFLYDMKAFDPEVHKACTGLTNELILENLKYLNDCGKKIEIRIPYVPEYNSGEPEKIAAFLKPLENVVKVRVLPYHNLSQSKYESLGLTAHMPEKLPEKEEIARAEALFT